jgi:hypothetical protein
MEFVEGKEWSWDEILELKEKRDRAIEWWRNSSRAIRQGYMFDDEINYWKKMESYFDEKHEQFAKEKKTGSLIEYIENSFLLQEVEPMEFYRDLFSRKELQAKGQLERDGKYNLLAFELEPMKARGEEWRWSDTGALVKDRNKLKEYGRFYEDEKLRGITVETKKGLKNISVFYDKEKIIVNDKPVSKTKRYVISEGLEDLEQIINKSEGFCFMSPISYCGKNKTKDNARFLYAMCIEIDDLCHNNYGDGEEQDGMASLLWQMRSVIPEPQYIVWSGNGVHLYYLLETPIALYKDNARHLGKWRRELTDVLWNSNITNLFKKEQKQYESLYQNFRIVGTKTKKGLRDNTEERARVFKVKNSEPVNLEYLVSFIYESRIKKSIKREERKEKDKKYIEKMKPSKMTVYEMKNKWGEDWYNRHFTAEGKPRKKPIRKYWETNRAFYDWFIKKVNEEVEEGHRYFAMWMACSVAQKCGVSKKEVQSDLEMLRENWNKVQGVKTFVSFSDIQDALREWNNAELKTYKWEYICQWCGLDYEPKKRNGRPQKIHLEMARSNKKILKENYELKEGRPSKEKIVRRWQELHPKGTKYQCQKETKLSKHTIRKWWR